MRDAPAAGPALIALIKNVRLWHTEEAGRWAVLHAIRLVSGLRLSQATPALVDAIFLAGGVSVAGIEAISSEIKIPLITGGGAGSLADLDWMAAHKVRVALQGHAPFSAAVQAVYDTLKALRDGVKPAELKNIASPDLMRQVTRAADYQRWTKEYLGAPEAD